MKYDDEVLLDVSQPERQWDKRYTRTEINWGQSNAIVAKAYKKHHLEEYGVPVSVVGRMTAKLLNGQINMYPITLVFLACTIS